MIVFARCDLARRASKHRVDGVHLGEALRQRASSIRGPGKPVDDHGRFGPLRIARALGQLDREYRVVVGFKSGEGDPLAVGRPIDPTGRLLEMSKLRRFAGVDPKDVQLVGAVAVREKGDSLTVGRPDRLAVPPGAAGELARSRAVDIDNPEIAYALVFDFVYPGSGENDLPAVGRNRRIADALHIHKGLFVERSFVSALL